MTENIPNTPEQSSSVSVEVDELLRNANTRPNPRKIAELIQLGLTEEDIVWAGQRQGYEIPDMTLTNVELTSAQPYLRKLADQLSRQYEDKRVFFLSRDAELLYDAYVTMYPQNDARLLPASIPLLESDDMADNNMARRFLDGMGLDEHLDDGHRGGGVLVDTGFKGTAGFFISKKLSELYGNSRQEIAQDLPIKLVSAIGMPNLRFGDQIMDFDKDSALVNDPFPKVSTVIGPYEAHDREKFGYDPVGYRLALSLQLMPHFTEAYVGLVQKAGEVIAFPKPGAAIRSNVDYVGVNEESAGRNASVVNPVAAMIIQKRLIESLLPQTA